MSSRITATAPANIAFIKYWGVRDRERVLPINPSISMTLSVCHTRTTVQPLPVGEADRIVVLDAAGRPLAEDAAFTRGIVEHLERIRRQAGVETPFRVATANSFPAGAGIASSASGFAALSLAAGTAAGLEITAERLSTLSRLSGSGSSARSALGGFVEWPAGDEPGQEHATGLAAQDHWELCDVVAVVDAGAKSVSSREGHRRAPSSPHFDRRLVELPGRLARVRDAILRRDLATLGPVLEAEAVELHLIAMSADPPIYYWKPPTLTVLRCVRELRDSGRAAWFTMDAGPNVHVICSPEDEPTVAERLSAIPGVVNVIRDRVGSGPALTSEHLF